MCGAFVFAADLVRTMSVAGLTVDCVRASSYGEGTSTSGAVRLSGLTSDVAGRHVLLVEDIVDTGLTLERLTTHLEGLGAASVRCVTLLNKASRRRNNLVPDFVGFEARPATAPARKGADKSSTPETRTLERGSDETHTVLFPHFSFCVCAVP
jgi:hypoxanthine phosphoribosyltransferase